jgi:hypothetical protein
VEKLCFEELKIFIKCVSYPSTNSAGGGGEILNKKNPDSKCQMIYLMGFHKPPISVSYFFPTFPGYG